MTNRFSRYLLILATLSGVCGISYEILYTRILSSYFGDIFYVAAAVLIGFLVSLALGAVLAHRYIRFLPHIEIAIGLYGLFAAYIFSNHAIEFVRAVSSIGAVDTTITLTISVILLLFIPALLIGFSVPIFAIYLSYYRPSDDSSAGFRHIYLFYNIGAALSVLTLEFYLIHSHGITASISFVAFLNLVVGLLLLRIKAPTAQAVAKETHVEKRLSVLYRYGLALLAVSTSSGIFQLLFLKTSHRIFGPLNENFAIVLATVFVGIAAGTFIVGRFRVRLSSLFLAGAAVVVGTFAFTSPVIYLWAHAQELFAIEMGLSALLKTVLMIVWGIAGFAFFGATVPAVLREYQGSYVVSPGRALAISALGNGVGFIVMVFILHRFFELSTVALISAAFVLLAAIIVRDIKKSSHALPIFLIVFAVSTSALVATWPATELRLGYEYFNHPQRITDTKSQITSAKSFKSFGDEVNVLYTTSNEQILSYNGYFSLHLGLDENTASFRETLVGITGALFSEHHDKALVLGLGTGITAGATSELYKNTRIVEVSLAMVRAAAEFNTLNFNVLEKDTVTVELQDGMVELINSNEKYDLIVNTVSSPIYFSAGKLWTREAFSLIYDRLTPGGVFSTWLDGRLGFIGTITQLKTLNEVFPHCTYFILNYQYHNVVCGKKELVFNETSPGTWPQSLVSQVIRHGSNDTVPRFLRDLQIEPPEEFYEKYEISIQGAALNTIDRPILEFVGDAHRYLEDVDTNLLFIQFIALPSSSVSEEDRFRRCNNISRVVQPHGFYDAFPECSLVLQNSL